MNGYNYLDGANPGLTNLSPDADKIIQDDGWLGGVRLHPDYAQYADEEAGWNAFGKGTKYNANNQTTSADSLKGHRAYVLDPSKRAPPAVLIFRTGSTLILREPRAGSHTELPRAG